MRAPALQDRDVVSNATMEGVAFDVPVERSGVERFLRRWDLGIARDSTRKKEHSITCELWSVTGGRPSIAGVDRHDAAARWTGLVAAITGAAFGAGLSWLEQMRSRDPSGAVARAAEGARAGFALGASMGGDRGRATSRLLALGPYYELMVGIPDVVTAPRSTRYTAVLGMITDSAIARSIDGWFDYGYGKELGAFTFSEPGSFAVKVGDEVRIQARFHVDAPGGARDRRRARWNERWTQPLLGGFRDGRLRASRLERTLRRGASCNWIRGDVDVSMGAFAPLAEARRRGVATPVHGAVFSDVAARISKSIPIR